MTTQDIPFIQGLKEGWAEPTPWDYRWEIAKGLISIGLIIVGVIGMVVSVSGRDMYLLVWGIAMTYFGSKL